MPKTAVFLIIEKGQKNRICIVAPSKVAYFDVLDLLGGDYTAGGTGGHPTSTDGDFGFAWGDYTAGKTGGHPTSTDGDFGFAWGGDYTALERAGTGLAQTSTLNGQYSMVNGQWSMVND